MSTGTNLVTVLISASGLGFSHRRQIKVTSRGSGFFALAVALLVFPAINTP